MSRLPRSPLRVALITFGLVLLIGMIVSLTIISASGNLDDHPHERGEAVGRGLALVGALAAVIAYLIQRSRLKK